MALSQRGAVIASDGGLPN